MIAKPVEKRHGFVDLRGHKTPQVKANSNVRIGDSEFFCMECKGEGGYGKVFKVIRFTYNCKMHTDTNQSKMFINFPISKGFFKLLRKSS